MKISSISYPEQRVWLDDPAEAIEDVEGHSLGDDLDPDVFAMQLEQQADFLEPNWGRVIKYL